MKFFQQADDKYKEDSLTRKGAKTVSIRIIAKTMRAKVLDVARDMLVPPLNRVDVINQSGTALKISSARGVIAKRCIVGDVNTGLTEYNSFPSLKMDAMVLNWGSELYTHSDKVGKTLVFALDAVFIKINSQGKAVVTDIIQVDPTEEKTRLPNQKSDLVMLFKSGEAKKRNIQIGDKLTAKLISKGL